MRTAGYTFQQIGDKLGVTVQAAHKSVMRSLKQTLQEPADELRKVELQRLDNCLSAIWKRALDGDCRAVETVLKIAERRSKLLGLDAPERQEVVGTLELLLEDLEKKRAEQRIPELPLVDDAISLEALGPSREEMISGSSSNGNGNGNGTHR